MHEEVRGTTPAVPFLPAIFALLLIMPVTALAQVQPKRSREPLPAIEVERGLVLPKGWFEVALSHSTGRVRGTWAADGSLDPFERRWVQHTQRAVLRYGLAPKVEVFGALPVHEGSAGTFTAAVGRASFGVRGELVGTDLPTTSWAVEVGSSGASGPEPDIARGLPDPANPLTFIGGTPSGWIASALRRQIGALALALRVEHHVYFPARVGLSVDWMDPGDHWVAEGSVLLQGGPVVVSAEPRVVRRGITRIAQQRVPNSDGIDLRSRFRAEIHASRGFEVGVFADLHLRGEDSMLYPIEEGTPPAMHRFGLVTRVHF